jgi:hypothetical protein
LIWLRIQDTVSLEEDLKFSDETVEDVIAPEALHNHIPNDEKRQEAA